jgi:phage shock protein PspC (stress-responsive transcriptional regulator)
VPGSIHAAIGAGRLHVHIDSLQESAMTGPKPRLVRPRDGRMIGGVCAGLARRFGTTSTIMRLIFVASCLLPGPQFLIYIALWILLPNE